MDKPLQGSTSLGILVLFQTGIYDSFKLKGSQESLFPNVTLNIAMLGWYLCIRINTFLVMLQCQGVLGIYNDPTIPGAIKRNTHK